MAKNDDIGHILKAWADWKMCRPTQDWQMPHPREFAPIGRSGSIPGSKPPAFVWMTPSWALYEFKAVDEAYEKLPDYVPNRPVTWPKEIIRLMYLHELKQAEIQRLLKLRHHSYVDRYRMAGCRAIDAFLRHHARY